MSEKNTEQPETRGSAATHLLGDLPFAYAFLVDVEILNAVQKETEAIADLVRDAYSVFDGHRDEWEASGLDRELLDELADRILRRCVLCRS